MLSTRTHYPDSWPTSRCSFSLSLRAQRRSNTFQYSLWLDQTGARAHDLIRGGSRISSQGGTHLKKSRRAEGGAKIFGVFRVKNHDFTTKNLIFSNCGGKRENLLGISCEKSRFNAKKSYFFQFQGGRAPSAPPWIRPC